MDVLEKKAEIEAMQAELQAEMDRIKEKAEQAEKIERTKASSKNMLANAVSRVKTKNHWVKRYAIEAKNVNVVVKKGTTTLTEIAKTYIDGDYNTVETFTEEVESLSLVYVNPNTKGEHRIDVDVDGDMGIPHSIANSFRSYKRISTVISKIEEYISNQNYKRERENAQETANKAAVAYLEEKYPNSTVTYKKGWYRSPYDRNGKGIDTHEVTVKHTNGVSVVMNIHTSNEENKTFKLGYKSVNLGDLTKDIEQLINTLDTI
ncbi:hypothetical protein OAA15_00750 [bacterium]|nr:hypothetical protein [bacterium]